MLAISQLLKHVPNRISEWFDFIDSSQITAFVSAAGTISVQSLPGGFMRLATGSSDNDACEARLDAAPFKLIEGRHIFIGLFNSPSDIDNADIGFGLATDDADVIGDGATATELLYVGFNDAGSSDGETPLTLFVKNGSGSESFVTGFVMKESKKYMLQMQIDVNAAGLAEVQLAFSEVTAYGEEQTTVVATDYKKFSLTYAPTGTLNFVAAIQAGEAAAKTWDFDAIGIDVPRHI